MTRDIPASIRDATTRCPSDLSCLKTGSCDKLPMCAGARLISKDFLALASAEARTCSYCIPFGNAAICSCPDRCELFRQQLSSQ